MSLHFHWFLPTNGDGRDIVGGGHGVATGSAGAIRPASLGYLGQVARSAEQLGFEAALTPTGAWCEDAWLATAMLTEVTERLKFIVAFRPGLTSPLLAAQMAATFQRYSRGRLLLNVVTGGESAEQRAYGDFLPKAERYRRCAEFLDIIKRLWDGETVTYHGEYLRVADARLARRPDPVPPLYFGGSSAEAGPVAARHLRVHPVRVPPPGGGLLVRRGRAAHPAPARPLAASSAGRRGRGYRHDAVRAHARSGPAGRHIVNSFFSRTGRGSSLAPAHPNRRWTSCG